jgi:hypothetical protein
VVADYWFDGVIPADVDPDRPSLPLLLDRTYVVVPCGAYEVYPPEPCASPVGTADTKLHSILVENGDFPEFPLKLRQELVLANRVESVMPDPRIPGLRRMDKSAVLAHFERGAVVGWDKFDADYPQAFGKLEVSRAVLSEDGSQALLYFDYGCGDLCGNGMLFLLRRDGDRWVVAGKTGLWVS